MNSSAVESASATPTSMPTSMPASAANSSTVVKKKNEDVESSQSNAPARQVWKNKLDSLMSMVVFAVGLGNVWRFPYLAFKHGGGTFLMVYVIYVTVLAIPMFMMEASLGQYTRMGALELWNIFPMLKGVGYANLFLTFYSLWYYHVLIIWALFYFFNSFASTFPWETCDNDWNVNSTKKVCVLTKVGGAKLNDTDRQTSVEQFFRNRVLKESDGFFEFNEIRGELVVLMLGLWIIIYFCLWRGATNARWYIWFSAIFPYVLLFIILARALTLEGAWLGIQAYLTPKLENLNDPVLWRDAGSQVFFSYAVGVGTISTLGAYNEFNGNVLRDFIATCFINGMTSITAGPSLAYITFPEAISQIPLKQVWAAGFFIMLFVLGLGTEVCFFEALYSSFEDSFPLLRKYKKIGIGFVCVFYMTISLLLLTVRNVLADGCGWLCSEWLFFKLIGIAWGYGAVELRKNVEDMMGIELGCYWTFNWKYAGPLLIFGTFTANCVLYTSVQESLGLAVPVPWSVSVFALFVTLSSMSVIPGYAIYYLLFKNREMTFKERLYKGTHPATELYKARVEKFSLFKKN